VNFLAKRTDLEGVGIKRHSLQVTPAMMHSLARTAPSSDECKPLAPHRGTRKTTIPTVPVLRQKGGTSIVDALALVDVDGERCFGKRHRDRGVLIWRNDTGERHRRRDANGRRPSSSKSFRRRKRTLILLSTSHAVTADFDRESATVLECPSVDKGPRRIIRLL